MGFQRREKAKAPIPGARAGGETSLSERRIKTLPVSPYSSKTWRKNPAKVLIPIDRGEGGTPNYQPVNTPRTRKPPKKSFPPTHHQRIYFQANKRRNKRQAAKTIPG